MSNLIDINCDMGEGLKNEHLFMPYITSCNIACGGHAGDMETMKRVVDLAIKHKVKIGAHPSYPDKENFGRKPMNISMTELANSIKEQVSTLDEIVKEQGGVLNHIKPHGALYNEVAEDMELANIFLNAISPFKDSCELYILSNCFAATLAKQNGFKVKEEAYADRNYNKDLSLVSRVKEDAVLTNVDTVIEHVMHIINGQVKTISGDLKTLKADSICVHSDTNNAHVLVKSLYSKLNELRYTIG